MPISSNPIIGMREWKEKRSEICDLKAGYRNDFRKVRDIVALHARVHLDI